VNGKGLLITHQYHLAMNIHLPTHNNTHRLIVQIIRTLCAYYTYIIIVSEQHNESNETHNYNKNVDYKNDT